MTNDTKSVSNSIQFNLSDSSNIESDLKVVIPKAINRYKRQGSGAHFVHGGASLQEMIIPLIESTRKRKDIGEKVPLKNIIGLFVAFIGIAILSGNPNLEGKMIGIVLILSGAFLWSLAQVFAKDVSEKIGGLALTAWLGIFSGPQCLIASYFIEGNTFNYIYNATSEAWIIVVYLAVGMNVIGYSCWYSVLSRNPVNNVMSVLLLFPVIGLS